MTDRDSVMKQLEECLSASCRGFRTCPYDKEWDAVKAAYDLLKEQEPVKPIKPRGSASWICGACKIAIGTSLIYRFCPWCGAEIKQDD